VSLDPNVRPRVIGDVAAFRQRFEGLLGTATIVKASIEDIELLYGAGSPRTVAQGWLARGPSLVVVTLGADGALAFTRDGSVVERPSPPVAVLDTVGAGDTFHAALLAILDRTGRLSPQGVSALTSEEIAGVLDFAAAAAAMVCMRRGADCPTWPEVDAFMTREP
jgi:fructokinase